MDYAEDDHGCPCLWEEQQRASASWTSSPTRSSRMEEKEPLPPPRPHLHHPTLSFRQRRLSPAVTTAAGPSLAWGSSAEGKPVLSPPGSLTNTQNMFSSSTGSSTFFCSAGSEACVSRWEVVAERCIWKQDVMTLVLNNRISSVKISSPLWFAA